MELQEIKKLTTDYASARKLLSERVTILNEKLSGIKLQRGRGLISAAATVAEARDRLREAINKAPHIFENPKTITIDGVRVGFVKSPGKIEFSLSKDQVVDLIKKKLPGRADSLIETKEHPVKKELLKLQAKDLA